ncbi:hypothetical protein ARMGADRAFT_1040748 [Armillaria gallica]|uniref:Uncharacterized protein n=1 Tax=Armillaria gallica TaxID=47427 RepID=A0A2H3CMB3_ARMGA|nr:hypothetical protein ARMGADRAFT_1040748 [Armillaria gallica]
MSEEISAAEAYKLAVKELFRLRNKRPLPDWTSGEVEAWVFNVHTQWSICSQNWGAAAEEPEWHDVEYSVLAELGSLPLCHVVYSREAYNILAARGRDNDLNCRPIPRPASTARAASTTTARSSISQSANQRHQQLVLPPSAPSRISSPAAEVRKSVSPAKFPLGDPTPHETPKPKSPIPRSVTPKPATPKLLLPRVETPKPASLTPARSPTPLTVPGTSSLGSTTKASSFAPPLTTSNIKEEGVDRSDLSAASDVGPGPTSSLLTIPTGRGTPSWTYSPRSEAVSHNSLVLNSDFPPPLDRRSGFAELSVNFKPAKEIVGIISLGCKGFGDKQPSIPPPRKSTRIAHPGGASSMPFGKGKRKSKAIVELEDDSEMDVDNSQAVVAKPPLKKRKQVKETIDLPLSFRQRGPGPSRVPVVAGISGGGFGEPTPASAVAISSTSKTVGVLYIDKDFGGFVEVDGRYWRKDVASFVGEKDPFSEVFSTPSPASSVKGRGLNAGSSSLTPLSAPGVIIPSVPVPSTAKRLFGLSSTIVLQVLVYYLAASVVLEKISQHRQTITGEYLDGSEEVLRLLRLAPTANAGQSNAATSAQIEEVEEVVPGPSDTHGTALT